MGRSKKIQHSHSAKRGYSVKNHQSKNFRLIRKVGKMPVEVATNEKIEQKEVTQDTDPNLREVINRVKSGNVLLFCGAGFSLSATSVNGKSPMTAKDLAKEICKIGGFNESENLEYASDRYVSEKSNIDPLVQLLKSTFNIKSVTDAMKNICSYSYRRIYTTNYDDAVEMASKSASVQRDSLCMVNFPRDNKDGNGVVHINGRAEQVDINALMNDDVRLTASSYAHMSRFEDSPWRSAFRMDMEQVSTILFIGYSLYDMDIERILAGSKNKDKTFFVIRQTESEEAIYKLRKYGTVLPVGTDAFGSTLGVCKNTPNAHMSAKCGVLNEYELTTGKERVAIGERIVEDFILHGALDSKYIDAKFLGNPLEHYLIKRDYLDKALDFINNGDSVLIKGGIGDGKSVFLDEMKSLLSTKAFRVFVASGNASTRDLVHDFDIIRKVDTEDSRYIVIVVDGYVKNIEFIEYIADKLTNMSLLVSERSGEFRRFAKEDIALDLRMLDVSDMLDSEISQMSSIVTDLGSWNGGEVNQGSSEVQKERYLKDVCHGNISTILLYVFKSEHMRTRFKDALKSMLDNEVKKQTILAICVATVMDVPISDAIIADIANNDMIYNTELCSDDNFIDIFMQDGHTVRINSPLAMALMQGLFDSVDIKNFLLDLAERFDKKKSTASKYDIYTDIFKKTMRFSVIERMLPDRNKKDTIVAFYEALKSRVSWLTAREPHYWMQYAMAQMMFKNLTKARQYMDAAYSCAKAKTAPYNTQPINVQDARLLILEAMEEADSRKIITKFVEAHSKLMGAKDDDFRFKPVNLYHELWDKKKTSLSEKDTSKFISCCKAMLDSIEHDNNADNGKTFQQCVSFLSTFNNASSNG